MNEVVDHNADEGEKLTALNAASVSPTEAAENNILNKKKYVDVGKTPSLESQTSASSRKYLKEGKTTQRLDGATESGHTGDSLHNTDENVQICPGVSTSVIQKGSIINSETISDKTPLLENESPNTSSTSELTIEDDTETLETSCECSIAFDRDSDRSSLNSLLATQTRESLMIPGSVKVPILGHETMESRSKFTVFKIHVMVEAEGPGWFIFRRYSDFVHLNDQLKVLFPNFRLALPPKRWFKSNFDSDFLEERILGLQAFVNNVTGHRDICNSKPVRDFFCFDEPPGPHDSIEESRAQCESMEDMMYTLKKELFEKDTEIELLKEEIDLYKNQVLLLTNRLGELNRRSSFERSGSRNKILSPSGDGHLGMNIFLESGEKLLAARKLNTIIKPSSLEVKSKEQIS